MKKFLLTAAIVAASISAYAGNDNDPLWLRRNSISPDGSTIAFTYKGDVWTVDAKGGDARRVTSNPAYDSRPMWTRDGQQIVFASNREKSFDLYVVDAQGGAPRRLTDHTGNEYPLTVLADGNVVFIANIQQDGIYSGYPGSPQIYTVGLNGGRPSQVTSLPLSDLNINANGLVLYEDYKGYEDPYRKHHTSSVTRDIWLYRPAQVAAKGGKAAKDGFSINAEGSFTKLSTFKGEDRNPVFAADGDTFYYLSEQDGNSNIWKSSISAPQTSVQLTTFKNHPVRYMSIANDNTLSFSYDGELYTLKEGAEAQKVNVNIVSDVLERAVQERPANGVSAVAVSPNGKELAVIIRGDVYVTSVEYATTKRITDTPEQERDVCFSKDGREVYYSSERNGHWGVWKTSLTEKKDKGFTYALKMKEERVTKEGVTCFDPKVSPDGKYLAYLQDRTAIVVKDIKSGKEKVVVDKNVNYSYVDGDQSFEWAPDSRHIMCNWQKDGGWNNEDIAIIDIDDCTAVDLTESGYSDQSFRWALGGKAVTWESDRAGYRSHGSWGAETDIYIMFLDGEAYNKFLLDEEGKAIAKMEAAAETGIKDAEKAEQKVEEKEKKDSVKTEKKNPKLKFDFENRKDRIIRLTPFSTKLGDHYLTKDGSKLYFQQPLEKSMDLCVLDLEEGSIRVVAKGVFGSIIPSADEMSFYILSRGGVMKLSPMSGQRTPIEIDAKRTYRPAQEREYIFNHAWKQVKDKFYDPAIHGIDWDMYKEAYAKFLPHINNNFDFQELLSEILGELNGSHTGARYFYRSGLSLGSLGIYADLDYEGDGIRIKEVIKGGAIYDADSEIKAGDIIMAIDGKPIKAGESWYPLLTSKAGDRVVISLKAKCGKTKDVFVSTKYSDNENLYKRWVAKNEALVAKLSGGRVAYVHVQGMDSDSYRSVYSDLLGKYRNHEAVIVDTRHNGGGWLHDDLASLLSGKEYIKYQPRGQYAGSDPYSKWTKPSCVLIGEDNYSDASGFPYVYKTLGIGKLVGAPVPGTMTAVWWETQVDPTIVFGIPQVGSWGIKEQRYLENYQIEPDIEVYNDPASELRGEDKQIEAAVKHMLEVIDADK